MRDKLGRFIKGHERPVEFIEKHRSRMLGHLCSEETRKKIGLANSKPKVEVKCDNCKKNFSIWPSRASYFNKHYCSNYCLSIGTFWKKGQKAWNKGLKGYSSGLVKCRMKGEENPAWKGKEVKYRALHSWVERELGKPSKCTNCGVTNLQGRQIHWANKSREYKRELSDWIRLCIKCHKVFDRVENQVVLSF